MAEVCWRHFPHVGSYEHARRWLQFTANIGRARNTVEAYGRALEDHLGFCGSVGADPLTLRADVIAAWIGDLHERPNSRAVNVLHLDSRVGLSNATIQQRIIAARSFYEYLVEDGLRERNPVRKGESGRRGRQPKRGLVRPIDAPPGFPTSWLGPASWTPAGPSRSGTDSWWPWLTTAPFDVRSWCRSRSTTSSQPTH